VSTLLLQDQTVDKTKESKLVIIKIICRNNHDDWEGSGVEALEKIMEETSNGRWAYSKLLKP
jgi:hypothetical protein